jgi:aconitase A
LENISNNTLIGATNADTGEINAVTNSITGDVGTVPEVAKQFKDAGVRFVIVAGENYGEGRHAVLLIFTYRLTFLRL